METVLGKYEVRATIASGPRSTIYEGWDTRIDRRVAVKKMPLSQVVQVEGWQDLARFRREAQAAARLQHPNVVTIFDYGETTEFAYIVMEFVEGSTLEAALVKGTRFPIAAISRLMSDILSGLQYCHQRGVIHRDIKPSNIMVSHDGQGKIADFGLARLDDSNLTQIGTIMGTPAYMSPEQFRGGTTDARTDIYSAGVILYQLLTGERPFDGGLATIMHKALNTEAPKPSDLSGTVGPSVDGVVARAMAKRPDQRFQSAKEFADALSAGLAMQTARPGRIAELWAALPRRGPPTVSQAYMIGGAALVVVAGLTAAIAYRPWASSRARTSSGEVRPLSPPEAAGALASPAATEVPRTEHLDVTSGSASTISSTPARQEVNAPPEPTDVKGEATLNPVQSITPPEGQPSSLAPPSVLTTVPTVAPVAPQPATPSPLILGATAAPQRGDLRAPGPRIRKLSAHPVDASPAVELSPPPPRPKAGARGRPDQEDAKLVAPGGQDKGAASTSHPTDQEPPKFSTPVPFGRFEVQDGRRVFVPAN